MKERANEDVRKRFGRRLAALRNHVEYSQELLALDSGLARSYLSEVERGKRNLSLVNICQLAQTLGVKPYVLLDFDGDLDPTKIAEVEKRLGRPASPNAQAPKSSGSER